MAQTFSAGAAEWRRPGHKELAMGAIATGGIRDDARAAAAPLRLQKPSRIVVAVLVSSPETCEEFRSEVDEIV